MVVVDYLRRNSSLYRDKTALIEINHDVVSPPTAGVRDSDGEESSRRQLYRRKITWKIFDEKSNRFANSLISRGIGKGDHVAILMMNEIEWLPIYFGILKAGAVAVPFSFRFTLDEIKYCLDLADVDAFVFGSRYIDVARQASAAGQSGMLLICVSDNCPDFAEKYSDLMSGSSTDDPHIRLTEDDDAAIYFSSGTTGLPKAVLHAHRALTQAAAVARDHHHQISEDVFLCLPPLYHTGGKMHWLGSLLTGGTGVLLRPATPHYIFDAMSSEKCTQLFLLVPWMQDILLAVERGELDPSDYRLDQWWLTYAGAQPVPKSLVQRWRKVFPHQSYDTDYGLTEAAGPGCVHLGIENYGHVGAIGLAGYGWQARVVDDDMNDAEPGHLGELAVKGPGVMKGYYKNPEATAETVIDGWLLTGDIARQEQDGFLWIVDRKKDVIIVGGENIYPVQLENFLATHEGIKDVAVIGFPDDRLGEIPLAIVELKPGVEQSEEDLVDFCMALPRFKRPRRIIFGDVPRSVTGKIEKKLLRRRYTLACKGWPE